MDWTVSILRRGNNWRRNYNKINYNIRFSRTDITVNAKIQDAGLDIKYADTFVLIFLIRIKDIL